MDKGADAIDVLIALYTSQAAPRDTSLVRASRVAPAGAFWIAWPKRSPGVPTDPNEDVLREVCVPAGMVDNKVCAINGTWSGPRFVVRKENRATWPSG